MKGRGPVNLIFLRFYHLVSLQDGFKNKYAPCCVWHHLCLDMIQKFILRSGVVLILCDKLSDWAILAVSENAVAPKIQM